MTSDFQSLEKRERQRVRFDATINLGHILTFVGFLVAGFGAWTTMDKRVMVLEEGRKVQEQVDRYQDASTRQTMEQIRESLTEIKAQVNRLNDRERTK